MAAGVRLDVLLVQRGLSESRERAQAAIMSGVVYVDGQKSEKPGHSVPETAEIEVREDPIGFVSRGGLKLQKALDSFGISVEGLRCIDAGASTGGFTDCMLSRGAMKVWAIDVGYGQLAWSLRNDERVVVMERTNIRYVTPEQLGECAEFAVADVSFISLRLVLPTLSTLLTPDAQMVALVKPQFEAGRDKVGKNGVIHDPKVHEEVLSRFAEDAHTAGFFLKRLTFSPIKGPKGNREFLAWLTRTECAAPDIAPVVAQAHKELP